MNGKEEFDLYSYEKFLSKINVSFESVLNNSVDYKAILKYSKKQYTHVPKRYSLNMNTSRRSAAYMLNYIEETFGSSFKLKFLKDLQIHESLFLKDEVDKKSNLTLSVDICSKIFNLTQNNQHLFNMGLNFYKNSQGTKLAELLNKNKGVNEVIIHLFDELVPTYVEKNFNWKIVKINDTSCIIEGRPTEEALEYFSEDIVHNNGMEKLRTGFLSSLSLFKSASRLPVNQLTSMSNGDGKDTYELLFQNIH